MAHRRRRLSKIDSSLAAEEPPKSAANSASKPWDTVDELVSLKAIAPDMAETVRRAADRAGIEPAEIIMQRSLASAETVARASASVACVQYADLRKFPFKRKMLEEFGASRALKLGCAPWRRVGKRTIFVATSRQAFDTATAELTLQDTYPVMALSDAANFAQSVTNCCRAGLVRAAEERVTQTDSCRSLALPDWGKWAAILGAAAFLLLCFQPAILLTTIAGFAVATLVATVLLKLGALTAVLAGSRKTHSKEGLQYQGLALDQLPRISIMVALYKETQIARHLVARLQRLNYPRELLEVLLVTESDDLTTQATLSNTRLPHWMRQVSVPTGKVKTKPRALNYALDHCTGSVIGVYDAEDAPEPDQLLTVAAHFARTGPDVACLQGRLDYYNPTQNWLARCFTMEYAAWFRVVLPGLALLRLPVPLGGTTLFFRRDALDALGAWDAHNVTEDADLGLRLARRGYRTELVDTVTFEEANCRPWPWIRQRSRWLKGYAVTYATHMRSPKRLYSDLGAWGFIGVQVLFACTLAQFLLAPMLWSFWGVLFGATHPFLFAMPSAALGVLVAFFILSEVLNIAVTVFGISQTSHEKLWPWALTMAAYFPMGTIAAYKGAYELAGRPFFWDKTSHGLALGATEVSASKPPGSTTQPGHSLAGSRKPYSSAT